ncbi:hypothetical protein BHK69_02875 [Bosea vaviloviae]|uniref:Uncharacterized protein n=1 Tax=Bosea vaviloviae TaxID=1526658 RepID=A0A1D7TWS2_9HYPH|nr:hypothetical protein BHK69_02875 [Bosea vaviloviae]
MGDVMRMVIERDAVIRHCEERSDEAIQGGLAERLSPVPMDCFAEPVLGLAKGKTRVLAMTGASRDDRETSDNGSAL